MNGQNISNMVIYSDGELELNVSVKNETIWLTQIQISDIFEKDQSVISRHIKNILKDNEVDEKSNMQKMHIANSDKPVSFYSLDIILAVGYNCTCPDFQFSIALAIVLEKHCKVLMKNIL